MVENHRRRRRHHHQQQQQQQHPHPFRHQQPPALQWQS
jgi:hypothetical protein